MVGIGYDMHRLEIGEKLILGGIEIESEIGTVAHSDGDVLLHSIIDAILGAAGMGDIGEHFPDTDIRYKGYSSVEMTKKIMNLLVNKGLKLVNIDAVVVLEKPKLLPYKNMIKIKIAEICNLPKERVNIKATTNEGLSYIGRGEGIVVHSICQIENVRN